MERPKFSEIKDYNEFCKYYWYREELIKILRRYDPSGKEKNKAF